MEKDTSTKNAAVNGHHTNSLFSDGDRTLFVPRTDTRGNSKNPELPQDLQSEMERSYGEDFSSVTIKKNSGRALQLNAAAFTRGNEVHFAPGRFNTASSKGKELIRHEFYHVKQQREGRVTPNARLGGERISTDSSLEKEATDNARRPAGAYGNDGGRQHTTGDAFGGAPVSVVQRQTLEERYPGQFGIAMDELNSIYEGQAGILGHQLQAIEDFTRDVSGEDPPNLLEVITEQALTVVVGSVVTAVGNRIKQYVVNRLTVSSLPTVNLLPDAPDTTRLSPEMRYANQLDIETHNDAVVGQVTNTHTALVTATASEIVDQMIRNGRSSATGHVSAALNSANRSHSTPQIFGSVQAMALRNIYREQGSTMRQQLAGLLNTPDPRDEWTRANVLYQGFEQNLASAYDIQYRTMANLWFASQVRGVGRGVRSGVLGIELDSVYPSENLTFDDTWLAGEGNNASIRQRIEQTPLQNLRMPIVIQMDGKLGGGWLPCTFGINIYAQINRSGPSISARSHSVDEMMSGTPSVQDVSSNRWGYAWLTAYHLGLNDLDNDDSRITASNVRAGANKVWNRIKGRRPSSLRAPY